MDLHIFNKAGAWGLVSVVQDWGFGVWGLGFGIRDFGSGIWDLVSEVCYLGSVVWNLKLGSERSMSEVTIN